MNNTAILIENLSKQYRLGVIGTKTLSNDINRWWAKLRGGPDPALKIGLENKLSTSGGDFIWALQEINLEISRGDIVGIIGKNGAGKSTLLKILSRVTTPTYGKIKMEGRVASLLEVGTGFHEELTGRENIFLNGSIMGMTKREIKSRFDEIVDFSGVNKYIDTPVKRYSSGMYVRLAFAVAAHLEPEILIVDEVLAVGDVEFQKKAIGKMKEVSSGHGRTVLFVSHNMSAIQNLCSRAILLANGKIKFQGSPIDTIDNYLKLNEKEFENNNLDTIHREGIGEIIVSEISIQNQNQVKVGSDLLMTVTLKNNTSKTLKGIHLDIGLDNILGNRVAHLSTRTLNKLITVIAKKELKLLFKVDHLPLIPGRYGLTIYCESNGQTQDWIKNAFSFDIENADFYHTGKLPPANQGSILLQYDIIQGGLS